MLEDYKTKTKQIVDNFRQKLNLIRGSRIDSSLIGDIKIEYYQQQIPLKQLATIRMPSVQEFSIEVWDKDAIPEITRALSKRGYSNRVSEKTIFVKLPPLSSERKQQIIKQVKSIAEQTRILIRAERDNFNKQIEQKYLDKELTEDQKFRLKEQIDQHTKEINNQIQQIVQSKIEEIQR